MLHPTTKKSAFLAIMYTQYHALPYYVNDFLNHNQYVAHQLGRFIEASGAEPDSLFVFFNEGVVSNGIKILATEVKAAPIPDTTLLSHPISEITILHN
jgi:hypothetical protein